jgi:hypothetical protein
MAYYRVKTINMNDRVNINMRVDDVPYSITATPCVYNSEIQYKVSINGNDEVIFVFDPEVGRYVAAGTMAFPCPMMWKWK